MKLCFKNLILLAIILAIINACNTSKKTNKIALKNETDSISYYFGILYGSHYARYNVDSLIGGTNFEAFLHGFKQGALRDSNITSPYIVEQYIDNKLKQKYEERIKVKYKEYIEENKNFLENNKKRKEVISLPSGLQYEILREGKGRRPEPNDNVKVHYLGTLIDGTVFDNSYERKTPAIFNVSQLIRGFSEALLLMPIGSKWKIYIPSELAYGSNEYGVIRPFSTLIFEVELLDIENPKNNDK